MTKPMLRVLIGPTASGKSATADVLADREQAAVLSVDSMQIYRELNIGTGKSSNSGNVSIRRYLTDWKDPQESCSVAEWLRAADRIIADCVARSVPLLAEGGTALYLKALREGIFEGPGRDEQLRARLEKEADASGTAALHERLAKVDPTAAARILVGDRRRLIRALEVYELTGRPVGALQTQWGRPRPELQVRFVLLEPPREALYASINRRVERMIAAGWVEECRTLMSRTPPLSREASQALGYRTLFAHLRGELSLAEAVELIRRDTRHFARRQLSWFRRFTDAERVPIPGEELAALSENAPGWEKIVHGWADRVAAVWNS